jgi:serine/threonine protein kinase/tetratricopeptide (TPR) repeat protein
MAIKCPKCHHENSDDTLYCGKCGILLRSVRGTDPTDVGPDPRSGRPSEDISVTKTLETPAQGLTAGSTFAGRYQIINELGKGGMGAVYRALDTQINEEVAIKLIRPEIASDEKTLERFSNELKLARKIGHKNVCKMFHLDKEGATPYISMEYLEGEDLKDLIRKKERLKPEEAIDVAKQVCEGLEEAHRLGVVHRDLKPQNIMMDKDGQAKIMDFGIARSVEAPGVTATGVIIGTPDYISPEQAEGQEADNRSDIYSLGVILYEMVTGTVPFKGDTALSVALKHKSQLPLDPRKLNPEVSDDLSRLVLICMEKERERRYQTAGALLADLQNIEEGLPLGTKIKPRRPTFIQTLIRKKLLIPTLVITLAVIAVAIWQLLPQKEVPVAPKIENSIAVVSFENQTGDEAFNHLQKLIPNLLITNLEDAGFFHVATWERMRDLLKQMDRGDVDIITSDFGFQACRREGIKALALGSYSKVGGTFVTDIKVLDVDTKRLLKSASSRGEGEDSIFAQIDELTRKISEGMGISPQTIEAAELNISEVTTRSIEAYKYYLKGREDYEKYYLIEARQSFEKAVILDPEFAMAYLYFARCLGYVEAKKEAYEKAKTYSEKTSEKEKLYIEAAYAEYIERDSEKRFRLLEQMTNKYPKEKRAHHELGRYYRNQKLYDKAIEEYNRALELDPSFGPSLNLIAYTYFQLENYEKAIEYFKKYASVSPGDANPLDSMADIYFRLGRLEDSVAKYKEALEVKPDWINSYVAISYINALKEDYSEAMKWIDQYVTIAPTREIGRANMLLLKGFYYFWIGRMDQSLEEIHKDWILADSEGNHLVRSWADWMEFWVYYEKGEHELAQKSWKNYFDFFIKNVPSANYKIVENTGLVQVGIKEGRFESAKARLAEIETLLPEIPNASLRNRFKQGHDLLHAEVLLAEGSYDEAFTIGKKVTLEFDQCWPFDIILGNVYTFSDVVARVYRQKGELDKAIVEYERMMTFDPESKERRLIHPLYHYRLAKLYEEKGKKRKAIEQYEKFLSLWKDADPCIAEIEDARKRLTGLRSLIEN